MGRGLGREPDDGKLDGEQDHQDQDANLHQPGQPVSLIGDGVHEFGRWSLVVCRRSSVVQGSSPVAGDFAVSRQREPLCQRLATNDQRLLFYPASFPIMANNGMYSEITMPPMLTPRTPMMTGSSMANMSFVAESTSSS